MPKAAIFYDSPGYRWADLATNREVAGPFDTLHEAFQDADRAGFSVVDVFRTRATFKPQAKSKQLPLPAPAEEP